MMRALWSSASGMVAQQKNIDVISNNISNVNTVGFKGSRADFQDLIYQDQADPDMETEWTVAARFETAGSCGEVVCDPIRYGRNHWRASPEVPDAKAGHQVSQNYRPRRRCLGLGDVSKCG